MTTGDDAERLLEDGVVQLRFRGEDDSLHDLNATEVADVLQGLVEFTSQMAKAGLFGSGYPPEVRVRPVKQGSFLVEALIQFAQENPEVAWGMALTAGGGVTESIRLAIRRLRGREASDIEYLENGGVKVTWPDDTVDEVPAEVWKELNQQSRKTKKALGKIMAPLGDDVSTLEVRQGGTEESSDDVMGTEPSDVLTRADYNAAVVPEPDPEDELDTFDLEAVAESIDFVPNSKWRLNYRFGNTRRNRQATMADEDFQRALDGGGAVHKGDILNLRIQEVVSVKNGRASTDWTIVKVLSQRAGSNDGEGEGTPS